MRILLVEDQPDAARMIAKGFREESYAVDIAADGETGGFKASTTDYDAIVLDLMLPRRDGLTVCREIRQEGSSVPILMLTARDGVEARVAGLDSGADDYLTKPFAFTSCSRGSGPSSAGRAGRCCPSACPSPGWSWTPPRIES